MIRHRNFHFKVLIMLMLFLCCLAFGVQAESNKTSSDIKGQKSSIIQTHKTIKISTPNLLRKTKIQAKSILMKCGLKTGKVVYVTTGKGKTGTIVKQSPKAKIKISKGSAVNIWILKQKGRLTTGKNTLPTRPGSQMSAKNVKPRLFEKNKKLYMKFPRMVQNVKICDRNGKILQRFKRGQKFDITKSLKLTKAGNIRIYFMPAPKPGGGVPKTRMHIPFPGNDKFIDLFGWRSLLNDFRPQPRLDLVNHSTIEDGENNNHFDRAVLLGKGWYEGKVDRSSDPRDYLKYRTGGSGFGSLVMISKVSGNIKISLYKPKKGGLISDNSKVWIALKPNTTFYFMIEPTASGPTTYTISLREKTLNDPHENNDTFRTAKEIREGTISGGLLVNLYDSGSNISGVRDYFKINLTEPKNIRITVNNAGLPSNNYVLIYLRNPSDTNIWNNEGGRENNSDRIVKNLRTYHTDANPFPPGFWRIMVTENVDHDYPSPYGEGDPPICYSGSGYSLTVEFLP